MNALSKALSAATLLVAPWVVEAGIGNIRVQSAQGEPLSARVSLSGDEAEAAVLTGQYSVSGSVPVNVRVSGSQDSPTLIISSSTPVTDEIVSLSVRAGDSVRLYSVALKPAAKAEEPKEEPAKPIEKEEKKIEEPKDTSIALGSRYTTQKKDTVRTIAQRMTDAKASQNQKIQAIVDKNPNAFVNGNSARMKSGVTLVIPTANEIANIEKKLAEKAAADKAKKEQEAQAKKEAEAKATAEKAKKEQEAQAKKEAEARAVAEKAEAEKLKKEQEAQAKKEAEARIAAEKAEAERLQKEQQAKADAEKAEAERLQQEQTAKELAEQQAQTEIVPIEEQKTDAVATEETPTKGKSSILPWVAGGAVLLGLLGFLLARRKGGDDDGDELTATLHPTSAPTVSDTAPEITATEEQTPTLKEQVATAIRERTDETQSVVEEPPKDLTAVDLPNLDLTHTEIDETPAFESTPVEDIAIEKPVTEESVAVADSVAVVEDTVEEVLTSQPKISPLDIQPLDIDLVEQTDDGEFVVNIDPTTSVSTEEGTYTSPEYVETSDNTFDFDFSDNNLQTPVEQFKESEVQENLGETFIEEEPSRRTPSVEDALQEGEKQKLAFDPNIGLDFILDDTPVAETIKSAKQDENYEEAPAIRQYQPAPLPRLDSDLNISESLRESMAATTLEEEPTAPVAEVPPMVEEPVIDMITEEAPPTLAIEEASEEILHPAMDVLPESEEPADLVEQAVESVLEQILPTVEDESALSLVEDEPVFSLVEDEPVLASEPPAPTVEEQTGANESPIPVATEMVEEVPTVEEIQPAVEEVVAAPVVEEVAATPVVEEVAATPVVEEVVAAPVVEEVVAAPVVEEVAAAPVVEEVATTPVVEEKTMPLSTNDKDAPLLAKLELAKMYLSQNDTEGTLEVLVDILDSCPPDSPIYKEAEGMFNSLDT